MPALHHCQSITASVRACLCVSQFSSPARRAATTKLLIASPHRTDVAFLEVAGVSSAGCQASESPAAVWAAAAPQCLLSERAPITDLDHDTPVQADCALITNTSVTVSPADTPALQLQVEYARPRVRATGWSRWTGLQLATDVTVNSCLPGVSGLRPGKVHHHHCS